MCVVRAYATKATSVGSGPIGGGPFAGGGGTSGHEKRAGMNRAHMRSLTCLDEVNYSGDDDEFDEIAAMTSRGNVGENEGGRWPLGNCLEQ